MTIVRLLVRVLLLRCTTRVQRCYTHQIDMACQGIKAMHTPVTERQSGPLEAVCAKRDQTSVGTRGSRQLASRASTTAQALLSLLQSKGE